MLYILQQYKNLFGMCLANYQSAPEALHYDDNNDGKIDTSEINDVLNTPEAKLAKMEAKLAQFGAVINFTRGNLTNEIKFDGTGTAVEYKSLQVLSKYILEAQGGERKNTSIDGKFGPNSLADLKSILGDTFAGEKLSVPDIFKLLSEADAAFTLFETKINDEKSAQEAKKSQAKEALSQYVSLEAISALTGEDAKKVQEALKTLGYSVGSVDGKIGNQTKVAFKQFLEAKVGETKEATITDAEAKIAEAKAKLAEEKAKLAELSDALVGAQEYLVQKNADIDTAMKSLKSVESTLSGLKASLGNVEQNIEDLQNELPSLEVREKMSKLIEEKNRLASLVSRLEKMYEKKALEIQKQIEDVEAKKGIVDGLEEQKTEIEEDIGKAEESIGRAEDFLSEARQESENIKGNDYASKSLAQMSAREREALQRDINALRAQKNEAPIATDGIIGKNSKAALEALGITNVDTRENFIELRDRALKARNDRQLVISSKEMEGVYKDETQIILTELSKLSKTSSPEEIQAIVETVMQTAKLSDSNDNTDKWTPENKAQRRIVAQYISSFLASRVDNGDITAMQASQMIEAVLGVEKFTNGPTNKQISRMLGTIDELKTLTRDEKGVEIAASLTQESALNAISRSKKTMDMGEVLAEGKFPNGLDLDLAENMYIVTGDGLQVLPLRDTGALKVRQWELVGNTIVGLMDNGCNGNVIYIPLDFVPAAPKKPAAKPSSKPVEPGVPTTPDIPDIGNNTKIEPVCEQDRYIWNYIYHMNPGTNFWTWTGQKYKTSERCNPHGGGSDHPSGGRDTSNPGTEGGSDNGGGGTGGDQGGGGRG